MFQSFQRQRQLHACSGHLKKIINEIQEFKINVELYKC